MAHKIVGLFKNQSDAQAAVRELTNQGFNVENTNLSNLRAADSENLKDVVTSTDGPPSGNLSNTEVSPSPDFVQSIEDFFHSLFGGDKTTANNYSNAARDAEAVVTVQASPSDSIDRIREILDNNGAIDVEDQNSNSHSASS